jgi:hypothetical protein
MIALSATWLWWRERSIGDTVLITRGTPAGVPGNRHVAQAWSSGGGVRLLVGRMERIQTAGPAPLPALPTTLRFEHGSYDPGSKPYPYERYLRPGDVAHTAGGFELFSRDYDITTYSERLWSITLPLWFMILVALALPTRTARRLWRTRRATRRAAQGLCPACGYDLRGSPDRCPECGRQATTQQP